MNIWLSSLTLGDIVVGWVAVGLLIGSLCIYRDYRKRESYTIGEFVGCIAFAALVGPILLIFATSLFFESEFWQKKLW